MIYVQKELSASDHYYIIAITIKHTFTFTIREDGNVIGSRFNCVTRAA